ncbi:MAG: PadR family transcriptional regulator [Anaerolineales bacterium]|jgi:DNA-binding PadR family transcriptional regulator
MTNSTSSPLPLSEPVFLILLSLASGQKHGYAILKEIESMSGEKLLLSTSTLYGALSRLENQGYIRRVQAGQPVAPGLPRKVYVITPDGLDLLHGEAERLQNLSHIARRYLPKTADQAG